MVLESENDFKTRQNSNSTNGGFAKIQQIFVKLTGHAGLFEIQCSKRSH